MNDHPRPVSREPGASGQNAQHGLQPFRAGEAFGGRSILLAKAPPRSGDRWRLAALILTGLALLGAPGCGRQAAQDDKVIRVTRNIGGREGFRLHWDAWKSAFEAGNPGWKMELIDLGNGDGAEYYKSRIATGDLPDIVQLWGLTKFLADGGNLQPLPDSYYEKFGAQLPTPYKGKRYATMGGLQLSGIAVNR